MSKAITATLATTKRETRPQAPKRLPPSRLRCNACHEWMEVGDLQPPEGRVCPHCGHQILPGREARLRCRWQELDARRRAAWASIDAHWEALKGLYGELDRLQAEEYGVLVELRKLGAELPEALEMFEEQG